MPKDNFDREAEIVKLYIDSAKSYSQVSVGALAFALFVAGDGAHLWANRTLLAGSTLFLLAVLAAIGYQALAVGRLESLSGLPIDGKRSVRESWYDNAYVSYNVMIGAFVLGAASLLAAIFLKVLGL
jgi:hypothetical protein